MTALPHGQTAGRTQAWVRGCRPRQLQEADPTKRGGEGEQESGVVDVRASRQAACARLSAWAGWLSDDLLGAGSWELAA